VTRKSRSKPDDAWDELWRRAKRIADVNLHTTPLPAAIDAVLDQIEMDSTAQKQRA
jgi:hypothetical protein